MFSLNFLIFLIFALARIAESLPKSSPKYPPLKCQPEQTEGSFELKYTSSEQNDYLTMDLTAVLNLYANADAIDQNAARKTPIVFKDGSQQCTKTLKAPATNATPSPWKFETKKLSHDFVVQPFLSYSSSNGAQSKAELRFTYGEQNFTSPNNKGDCQFDGGTLDGPSNVKVSCYTVIGPGKWWVEFTGNFCYLTSDLAG